MKKIIMLGTDTPHRRYFIRKLLAQDIPIQAVVFETTSIKPPFATGPFLEAEESSFEQENFFRDFDDRLDTVPVKYVENINHPESQEYIRFCQPDLALVFGTRKVAPRIIRLFREGAINVHRGIAEEYRGMDTNMWAVYHTDFENIGVTIHRVDNDLDTGDIIFQERLQYPPDIQAFQMRYYESVLSAELAAKALQQYLGGKLPSRKQVKKGRYYSFMPLVIKELLPERLKKYELVSA